jgi:hypothetical protein
MMHWWNGGRDGVWAVDQYDFLAQQWRACDGHIEGCLQTCVPDGETDAPPSPPARPWRSSRSNPLSFEVQASLEAMTGVDLTQIDGIDSLTALKVISEIGLDRVAGKSGDYSIFAGFWYGSRGAFIL